MFQFVGILTRNDEVKTTVLWPQLENHTPDLLSWYQFGCISNLWHWGWQLLSMRVLERSLVGWRSVGGGLWVSNKRGREAFAASPLRASGVWAAGVVEAQPKEGAVMDRVGGEQTVCSLAGQFSFCVRVRRIPAMSWKCTGLDSDCRCHW